MLGARVGWRVRSACCLLIAHAFSFVAALFLSCHMSRVPDSCSCLFCGMRMRPVGCRQSAFFVMFSRLDADYAGPRSCCYFLLPLFLFLLFYRPLCSRKMVVKHRPSHVGGKTKPACDVMMRIGEVSSSDVVTGEPRVAAGFQRHRGGFGEASHESGDGGIRSTGTSPDSSEGGGGGLVN